MEKILDLKKTVADLVGEYPEVRQIMADVGFREITSDVALNVMGRIMTIPRGAARIHRAALGRRGLGIRT